MSEEAPNPLARWLFDYVATPAFVAKYPYYAAILSILRVVDDPSVERMALTLHEGQWYLHINVPAFAAEPQFLPGILLHEIHHMVLGHLSSARYRDAAHPELMSIALEVSANEYIAEPLPDPMTWELFQKQGLGPGQSTLERYERLCAWMEAQEEGVVLPRPRHVDSHRWEEQAPPPSSEQALTRLRNILRDHPAPDLPAPTRRGQASAPGKIAGKLPAQILEGLERHDTPPQAFIDWRRALERFVSDRNRRVASFRRPSRRFPQRIGEVPGRTLLHWQSELPSLLVAIDTSMSMSRSELNEVARQLRRLALLARLTIVECDTEIQRVYAFEGDLRQVRGRGGTDLRPVFAEALLQAHRPHGIVYFTDGLGPYPPHPPAVETLWVLTRPENFECDWGRKALLAWPASHSAKRGPRSG